MSETSTATTIEAIAAPDKQALPLTPQSQWAQPELSLGVQLGSVDVLGRYKCWQVLDKSPAYLVWEAVFKPITKLLEEEHEHLNARDLQLRLNMYMIGRKPARSRPTILFSCKNKPPRQKAMELVSKKGLLAAYPGVKMAESSRVLKWLGIGSESNSTYYSPAVYISGSIKSCGTPILVSAIDGEPPRKATMGGIVCVDDRCYGLTAAHPFLDTSEWDDSAEDGGDFAFYRQEDSDGNSSTEEDSVDITGMGSISSASSLSQATHTSGGSQLHTLVMTRDVAISAEDDHTGDINSESTKTEREVLGTLYTASTPDGSLDWALISLTHLSLQIISEADHILGNTVHWKEKILYPENLAHRPADVKVLACTGSNILSSSAALKGTLSAVASFAKWPGSTTFQELWIVRLDNGSFYGGDCGSWIVDFETGDVYGHVVSGHPDATDTAYIIPATQIFRDMERTVEKPVKLSTREMRASFQRRMKGSTTNSDTHEASNITSNAPSFKPAIPQQPVFDAKSIDLDGGVAASVISIPLTYLTAISTAGLGSFSVSKGDMSLTLQAWNLLRVCYTSTAEEFRGISGEICSLHMILGDAIEAVENDSFNLSHTRANSLDKILDQVEAVLGELESEIINYNAMDTATRQRWQVKGWGLLAASVIQQRIIHIITALNAFISAIKESSHSRTKQIILKALQEIREGYDRGSTTSSISHESLDTQQAWDQLKEQIESLGFTETAPAEKEEFVINQIQGAVDDVGVKELIIPDGESALSPNFSSSSTAAEKFNDQIASLNNIYKGLAISDPHDISMEIQGQTTWSSSLVKSLVGKLLDSSNMAILEAANEDDLEGLVKLIKEGVNVNTADKWDWTALHMAAYCGYGQMVEVLIKEGADLDGGTFDNETPLELAVNRGNVEVARIIKEEMRKRAETRQI